MDVGALINPSRLLKFTPEGTLIFGPAKTRVSSFGSAKWSPPQLVLTAEVRLKSRQSEFTKMGDR